MSKSIITASQISGSSVGTGSFGHLEATKAMIGEHSIYETDFPSSGSTLHIHEIVDDSGGVDFGNEAHIVISTGVNATGAQGYQGSLWFGTSDHPAAGGTANAGTQFVWRNAGIASQTSGDTGIGTGKGNLEFYTNNGSGTSTKRLEITEEGVISGSLTSTGSFGNVKVVGKADIGNADFSGNINMTGDGVHTINTANDVPLRVKSTDGTAAISIADNSSGAETHNRIQVVGDVMQLIAANKALANLYTNSFTINEDSNDIDFRVEANDDANAFKIDAATNKIMIGTNVVGDEKFKVAGDVGITGSLHVSGNITTSGSIIAKEFRTEFVNQIIATSSGSTTFGDTIDDVHRFTGSFFVTSSNVDIAGVQIDSNGDLNVQHLIEHQGNTNTYVQFTNDRLRFAAGGEVLLDLTEASQDVVKLGDGGDVDINLNDDMFLQGSTGNVGIGATEGNIGARLEVQAPTGSVPMQIRPSDPSTALNPLIQFRSQLNGTVNYLMAGNGGHLYFATYDSGTPTDVSKMIRFSPDATLSPKMYMGDDGSAESTFRVGGPSNGVFVLGGGSGSMVSSSRLGSGSFGHIIVDGSTDSAKNLEVTGSAGFTHTLRLGRSSSNNRGLIVLEKSNNGDDTGLAWLNTGGSYSATMYVSKSVGDFVFANTGVSGDLTTQNPNFVISSSGDVRMKSGAKLLLDNADAEGHTYISETADDILEIVVGGEVQLKLTEAGNGVEIPVDSHPLKIGAGSDLQFTHNGTDSFIDNYTGTLNITNNTDDGDIVLKSDDGSGGTTAYITLVGGSTLIDVAKNMRFADSIKSMYGASSDLQVYHNGTNSFGADNYTGHLIFQNRADDSDIIFKTDDGSGGVTTYIELDGSTVKTDFKKPISVEDSGFFADSSVLYFGAGNDLRIHHDGSNSYIQQTGTGDLYIQQTIDDKDIILLSDDGSGGTTAYITLDGGLGYTTSQKDFRLLADNINLGVGASTDLYFYHDGTNTWMRNKTGNLYIRNEGDDQDIYIQVDDGGGNNINALIIDASDVGTVKLPNDNQSLYLGAGNDLRLIHDGTNSYVYAYNGPLYVGAVGTDQDVFIRGNDSGSSINAVSFDMSDAGTALFNHDVRMLDNSRYFMGTSNDFQMMHDGTNSHIENLTGDLYITQHKDDKDIIFRCDDGSGGVTNYMIFDGSANTINVAKNLDIGNGADNVRVRLGAGQDLQLGHDGTNSFISNSTGNLDIKNFGDNTDIILYSDDGGGGVTAYLTLDGSVTKTIFNQDAALSATKKLFFDGGGNTYIYEDAADRVRFFVGGAEFLRFTETTTNEISLYENVVLPATKKLFFDGGSNTYIHEQSADDLEIVVGGDVLAKFEGDTIVLGGGYAVSSSLAFFGQPESPKHMAYGQHTVASEGWHRLARCGTVADGASNGTRASAKFTVYDTDSSRHSAVTFYVSGHFGQNFNIHIINSSDFGGTHGVIEQIRIVHGSTYEGFGVDVYVKNLGDSTVRYVMEENYQDNGWTPENFAAVAADPPTNMAATAISCSYDSKNVIDGLAHGNGTTNGAVSWYKLENGTHYLSGSGDLDITGDYTSATGIFQSANASTNLKLRRGTNDDDIIEIEASETKIYGDAVERVRFGSYGIRSNYTGSAGTPAYSFVDDTNTGILTTAADTIGFSTGGSTRFTMNGSGVLYVSSKVQAGNNGVEIWDSTHGFKQVLGKDSTYTKLLNNDGAVCLYLGDGGDRNNYHDAGGHRFRSATGGTYFGSINGTGLRLGTGNSFASTRLDVDGTSNFTDTMYIDHGGSDYSPNISFLGGSNTPGSNAHENAIIGYYDNSGTGNMLFKGNRGAMNWHFNDDGDSLFLMASSGDFHADGDVIAASTTTSSDIRLKKNINDIPYGLNEVLQLRGVEFDWKEKRDGKHDIGVIAQEIEKIIPEVVQESKDLNSDTMYKSVDYGKLVAVLVEAVKEQQVQIEELKEDINKLRGDK